MAVLQLRYFPAEVLRKVAEPVTEFGDDLRKLAENMAETMYVEHGIGLAAPQVGVGKRLFVMDVPRDEEDPRPAFGLTAFVNPEIVDKQGTIIWEEGCLSFPGLTADVKRAETIRVRFQDLNGVAREIAATGLDAVCIQHEHDHLDGITFVDHLSPLKRRLLLRELKKVLAEMGVTP